MNKETKPSIKNPKDLGKIFWPIQIAKATGVGGRENAQEVLDDLSSISAGAKQLGELLIRCPI